MSINPSISKYKVQFAGVCALILTMGVARYSFTPMIPHMQTQMGMSDSLAGWLAGWNYIGYLVGLFMVWLMSDLRLKDYFYRYSLFLAVIATAVMAVHDSPLIWYLSRFFAGISTALGFMLSAGLVLKWLRHNGHKQELGLHFAGNGLGIVLGALVVMFTATGGGGLVELSWREQWFVLAGVGGLLLVPALLWLPLPASELIDSASIDDRRTEPSAKWLWLLQLAYICAGFSNTVNVTFTSLITELQPLQGQGALMWLFVGLAAAPAPFVWGVVARKTSFLSALQLAFVINILSNLLFSVAGNFVTTMISSVAFGFAFMGIVSLTLNIVGNRYGYRATQVMARLTVSYCIAQILSPIISGIVAELTGSFYLSLYVVSGLMAAGLVFLIMMVVEEDKLSAQADAQESTAAVVS